MSTTEVQCDESIPNIKVDFNFNFLITQRTYENSICLEHKKSNGVFYTDLDLAELMIEELEIPSNAQILDPCCGFGSFLFALAKRGINQIYGIDIDAKAIRKCKEHNPKAKLVEFDSIANKGIDSLSQLGLKNGVDIVVGNPPYALLTNGRKIISSDAQFINKVREYGNNLFVAALLRSFELVKEDGIISYIVPKNFLHVMSYKKLRQEILQNKTILSIIDIGSYFKHVRGEQIILTLKNSLPTDNHKIRIRKLEHQKVVDKSDVLQRFFTNEIILFESQEDLSIYQNLIYSFSKVGDFAIKIYRGKSKDKDAITGKDVLKFRYKNNNLIPKGNKLYIQNIYSSESGVIGVLGDDFKVSETITVIETIDENFARYLLGVLHSKVCNFFLYKFCYNSSKLTMHTDASYLSKIPLPVPSEDILGRVVKTVKSLERAKYLSNDWLNLMGVIDDLVFKAYKLESETEYITSELGRIQSKKWNKEITKSW